MKTYMPPSRELTPVQCDTHQLVLGKPADWDDERDGRCDGLPVWRTSKDFLSVWSLTWRQRLSIFLGGNIALWVIGRAHPPVMLAVTDLKPLSYER